MVALEKPFKILDYSESSSLDAHHWVTCLSPLLLALWVAGLHSGSSFWGILGVPNRVRMASCNPSSTPVFASVSTILFKLEKPLAQRLLFKAPRNRKYKNDACVCVGGGATARYN